MALRGAIRKASWLAPWFLLWDVYRVADGCGVDTSDPSVIRIATTATRSAGYCPRAVLTGLAPHHYNFSIHEWFKLSSASLEIGQFMENLKYKLLCTSKDRREGKQNKIIFSDFLRAFSLLNNFYRQISWEQMKLQTCFHSFGEFKLNFFPANLNIFSWTAFIATSASRLMWLASGRSKMIPADSNCAKISWQGISNSENMNRNFDKRGNDEQSAEKKYFLP